MLGVLHAGRDSSGLLVAIGERSMIIERRRKGKFSVWGNETVLLLRGVLLKSVTREDTFVRERRDTRDREGKE